jgi:hypothetical protein
VPPSQVKWIVVGKLYMPFLFPNQRGSSIPIMRAATFRPAGALVHVAMWSAWLGDVPLAVKNLSDRERNNPNAEG